LDYEGIERRKDVNMSQEERDLLIRIDTNLSNLITNFNTHIQVDSLSFKEVNSKIGWLQKIAFMGLGALGLMKLFLG